ncbi:hypothetical protein I312_105911 [Cryptococcus bacillisporus CA1280]|uniref:uncharacterized protein n=1 Tax=Cryptococcus bacillisporus CA1280 TaxID=1296109 RepID=UPI00336986D0
MAQQGYAVVDVDEDPSGPSHGSGLEFQTFLPSQADARHPNAPSPPDVPFSPFNLTYYQTYFDVDTNTVLKRVGMAMIPRPGFITEVCDGQIDMYGSFWTLTTLILTLYTSSTLTTSIAQYMSSSHASSNLPLLSTATSAIYVYGLLVPSLLWGATKWLGIGEWGIAEALGIYGYAMSIFIPLSLLCLIPTELMSELETYILCLLHLIISLPAYLLLLWLCCMQPWLSQSRFSSLGPDPVSDLT